MNVIVLQVRRA